MAEATVSPVEKLIGMEIPGGWKIVERIEPQASDTGMKNSRCYRVEREDGARGFLKVLDIAEALRCYNSLRVLNDQTSAFLHEQELSRRCREGRFRRVASAIDAGEIKVDDSIVGRVPYMLFDMADGDVRKHLDAAAWFDVAWVLRSLHHVATGLSQLHGAGIAHQDTKPSNVLVYEQRVSKVADLGRAVTRGLVAPHDEDSIAGDESYAPPELLYGHIDPDWNRRRFGCDAYHLGSLIVFLFAKTNMTALMSQEMDGQHHWRQWRGPYEEILPYLRDGFGRAVNLFNADIEYDAFRGDLTLMVRELCDPDPRLRGHPLNRTSGRNQYSLERYVSKLNVLATKAEYGQF
jgi:eukaryotic-like serine/threonine-protein kinase